MKHIYPKIKDLREDADKTQAEIAPILDTTREQYSRWERGAQEIPLHNIITLARYYNVSIDYIVGLPEGMPYGHSKTRKRGGN